MPRRRMIDPDIWQNENFSKLSTLAKLVFIGLFSNADDQGRGRAKPVYIKSILFPYDENIRSADIDKTLQEIGSKMSVTFYSSNENEYYCLDNWTKWQRVDKPQPSKIPSPPEDLNQHKYEEKSDSGVIPELVRNDSRTIPESFSPKRKEREREKNIKQENPPIVPQGTDCVGKKTQTESLTIEMVQAADTRDLSVSAQHSKTFEERFILFWQAYPKKVGKGEAEKRFMKIKPSKALLDTMLDAIETAKQSSQWKKENGQFIPNPATWLNQKRWEDELVPKPAKEPESKTDSGRFMW